MAHTPIQGKLPVSPLVTTVCNHYCYRIAPPPPHSLSLFFRSPFFPPSLSLSLSPSPLFSPLTASGEEGVYDNRMMTIRQTSAQDSSSLIDITPFPQKSTPAHHDYGNVGIGSPNGAMGEDSLYDNKVVEEARGREHTTGNVYDDPHALAKPAVLSSTPAGIYDNPNEVQFGQERPEEGGMNLYDNQAAVAREIREQDGKEASLSSPRFDDTIYMRRSNDNANGNVKKDPLENMGKCG